MITTSGSYGRRFLSRRSSSVSSSSSISLRLPISDETAETSSSPPAKKVVKSPSSSSSESNIFHHHHRHHHHYYFDDLHKTTTSSSSRPLKSQKLPHNLSSSAADGETITPDSAIIPSVRCAFCLPCCLLLCLLIVLAVVLVVLLLLNLFQLNFSLPSRWSGQLSFAGTYVFSDAFKSNWSPGTPSSLRRADSLPYEFAKAEGERVVIEKISGGNHSYSLTASNPSIKSQAATPEVMLRFTENVPVEVTRVVDEYQAVLSRFRVTVSITGADWVETYEPISERRLPKIEIRREFTRDSMTVSYVVGKAVYVKRFEKL